MGIAQWRDSCEDRPHTHQPEPHDEKEHLLLTTKEKRSRLRRLRTRGLLAPRELRACAERASKPCTTNLDRISKTTKELLERRRALRLDPNASHIGRLLTNTSCRKALQEDLLKYRQKILEAAQRRTSRKKCRKDLREYIPLAALLSEDGTRTSSRREMEIITEKFYSNLFRPSTPVSSPIIPTGEASPRILPSEVRVAIKSMKPGTAPGPDFISADFLRAGGHPLHIILAAYMTSYLQKERIPDQWKTSRTVLIHKKGDREDLRNYCPIWLLSVLYKVFTKIILTRIGRWMKPSLKNKLDSARGSAAWTTSRPCRGS
ncbi:hypothetical protein RB195_015267 [Necator americanus]|uniref:Reverse transcriptase domain-containing protein n=1 Tax=Necator americanus TaxID=51031 RepID=A0ABR1E3R9_NECAM